MSYTTIPSFQMTPSRNLPPTSTDRQGMGKHFGSSFQGSVSTTFFAKNSMSFRVRAIGPFTELTASCPTSPDLALASNVSTRALAHTAALTCRESAERRSQREDTSACRGYTQRATWITSVTCLKKHVSTVSAHQCQCQFLAQIPLQ